jgi:hypothetical protein
LDGDRFDELTIALGARRRTVLRALLAGAGAALVGLDRAGAGGTPACKAPGGTCRKAGDCCDTRCKRKRGAKKGRCADCPGGTQYCGGVCCPAGESCFGGACTCGAASCPGGCCGGGVCRPGTADGACGTDGGACAACEDGRRCVGGQCVCDDQSCADGCCQGGTCHVDDDGACGTGGGTCLACAAGQRCRDGECGPPYGPSTCETPTTVCGPGIVTCGGDPNCWAMPATSGFCACSAAPGRSHRTCTSDADCVVRARCDPLVRRCNGDTALACTTDADCASLATCRDGECGGPICTTDADCEAAVGPGTVCISGADLPCTAGGANICWTLCAGA